METSVCLFQECPPFPYSLLIAKGIDYIILLFPFFIPTYLIFYFLYFSGFFPVVVNFLRRVPIIGNILNLPVISTVSINIL